MKQQLRKTEHASDPYLFDWFGNNLPSAKTFFVTDIDLFIRSKQGCIMLIEVKRKMSAVKTHQRATFQILNHALLNINNTSILLQIGEYNFSQNVSYFGLHLLQFENTSFEDGKVFFDGYEITEKRLISLLSFQFCDTCF